MSKTLKYLTAAVTAVIAFAVPANAAILFNGVSNVKNVSKRNDFRSQLAGLGLTAQSATFDTISVEGGLATLSVFRVAAESRYTNTLVANGDIFAETNDAWDPNDFLTSFGASGNLEGLITFRSNGNAAQSSSFSSGNIVVFLPTGFAAASFRAREVFLGFNDSARSDSDHDDYIVRLSTAAPVPEPAAWLTLLAGFGLVGAATRRRQIKSILA